MTAANPIPERCPDPDLIWRALADPTRRRILDLLREGPRTTGEIAEEFEQTRFGVMKHLTVLTEAGLIVVLREGRKRWNHLNPMPLLEVYRRWVRPFEGAAMERLGRLRHHAERSAKEGR
jgi:DNA-binding transcriptional ArsR family regulator